MRVRYDNECDALYVPIDRRATVARTEQIDERRFADLDAGGALVGIEVLAVAKGIKLVDIARRYGLEGRDAELEQIEKHLFQPMVYTPKVDRQRAL